MTARLQDVNIEEISRMLSPRELKAEFPMTPQGAKTVLDGREAVRAILRGEDRRFLVVVGPCSIHSAEGALEYAAKLKKIQEETQDVFFVLMRVYFEKPRTTIGWKGMINDPLLDGTCKMDEGVRRGRKLLLEINGMGIPAGTEFLDPIVPQYTADLVSWAAIGARTTESQTHREMASGLSMPVGFKNGTDGSLQVAIDAMKSAEHAHRFLGIDQDGATAMVKTKGNPWGHVILRGGHKRTNYDTESIFDASERLQAVKLPSGVMVDCSHANSEKKAERQEMVWESLMTLRAEANGASPLMGAMVESNLRAGSQKFPNATGQLDPGISITDACIGWEMTERLLLSGAETLRKAAGVVGLGYAF